jgi:type VI secretion system secreted protein VgrG
MPPWSLPDDSTRMGFMTRSKDGNKDNASYLFFEDRPGSEAVELHSEKNMKVSVENDKTVNVDGNRTTTILKEQKDDVTGDASFYYRAKRTTTVDDAEVKNFNNGEVINITGGSKLNIKSGGYEGYINDKKIEKILGPRSTTIEKGDYLLIESDGQDQNIKGNVNVNIDGNWVQKIINGGIHISSPNTITIKSDSEVNIDSPYFNSNAHLHQETYAASAIGLNLSNIGINLSNVGYSIFEYSGKKFDLANRDVRVELKTKAAIFMRSVMIHTASLSTFF